MCTMGTVTIAPVLPFPAWLICLPWRWRYQVPPNICTYIPNYIAHYIAEYQNLIYTYTTKSVKLSFPISDNTDNNKDVQTFVSFVLKKLL
jgi:hypothetical protein